MPNIRIKIFSDVRIIEFYEVSHTSEDLRTFLQWIQHIIKYTKTAAVPVTCLKWIIQLFSRWEILCFPDNRRNQTKWVGFV